MIIFLHEIFKAIGGKTLNNIDVINIVIFLENNVFI